MSRVNKKKLHFIFFGYNRFALLNFIYNTVDILVRHVTLIY